MTKLALLDTITGLWDINYSLLARFLQKQDSVCTSSPKVIQSIQVLTHLHGAACEFGIIDKRARSHATIAVATDPGVFGDFLDTSIVFISRRARANRAGSLYNC